MKRKTTITIILIGIIIIASVSSIFFYNKEHKVMETKKEVKELLQEKVSISDLKQKGPLYIYGGSATDVM